MAFIQCSSTGTALSWYIRLNDTYKQDSHVFVQQAFKKQFSSQKNAYYAHVEALNFKKKDIETVRHFALEVQQLFEKGWCNENESTSNLKCNEIFTKGLPKNLKGFANRRQVKHTSTVLEPSIPSHKLVKLVDAEDIANDKIGTHDLALEVNNITKQLQTQTLDSSSQEQLMFAQSRDPSNKNKPAYKQYCSCCHRTNHSISIVSKKQRDAYARLKSPQNHLYSTFVLLLMTEQNDMIHDIEVEVLHGTTLTTKSIHKIDIVLHLEIDLVMTKILPLHNTLDHDMMIIIETQDLVVPFTDILIDLLTDTTLVLDIDHVHIEETVMILQNLYLHIHHLQDQEIQDFLDPVHTQVLEIKSI